jgi:hypothetical protein
MLACGIARSLAPLILFLVPKPSLETLQVLKLRFHLYANIYAQCFETDDIKDMKQSFGEERVRKRGA